MVAVTILPMAGCETTPDTIFVQEPLPVPDRPALPKVPADDMRCLPDDAYEALATRDAELQGHVGRLEAILRTTHRQEKRAP